MHNTVLAWFLSAAATASGIAFFFKKYGSRILLDIDIARDCLDLVDDVVLALEPDADGNIKITPEELKALEDKANEIKQHLTGKGIKR